MSAEKIAKLHFVTLLDFVTLSEAKGLCPKYRILCFAQNDRLQRQFCNNLGSGTLPIAEYKLESSRLSLYSVRQV